MRRVKGIAIMGQSRAAIAFKVRAAEAEEEAVVRQRLADFDRPKFAGEVAGHGMRPDDEAFHRSLVAKGLSSDQIVAELKAYFARFSSSRS